MVNRTDIDAMRASLAAGVQTVTAPQLFETPPDIAAFMARELDASETDLILEPSAGTGRLIDAVLEASPVDVLQIAIVEHNSALCDGLARKYKRVYPGDFLNRCAWELGGPFDKIIMNPPFVSGADMAHIKHALKMLKPGGRLVGICAGGPRQEREIKPLAFDWWPLPPGTFKNAGTMVNAVCFTIDY